MLFSHLQGTHVMKLTIIVSALFVAIFTHHIYGASAIEADKAKSKSTTVRFMTWKHDVFLLILDKRNDLDDLRTIVAGKITALFNVAIEAEDVELLPTYLTELGSPKVVPLAGYVTNESLNEYLNNPDNADNNVLHTPSRGSPFSIVVKKDKLRYLNHLRQNDLPNLSPSGSRAASFLWANYSQSLANEQINQNRSNQPPVNYPSHNPNLPVFASYESALNDCHWNKRDAA